MTVAMKHGQAGANAVTDIFDYRFHFLGSRDRTLYLYSNVTVRKPGDYSYRSATNGSTFVARRAGM